MWVWRVPSAPNPQLSQTETYAIVDPLRGDPRFERASPPQDLPHFPRNHTRDSTHYLSRRPEVSSQDEKSRKAETRGSLGTPGVTISKRLCGIPFMARPPVVSGGRRSEEHTSELQSPYDLVCRLLLEKKKKTKRTYE